MPALVDVLVCGAGPAGAAAAIAARRSDPAASIVLLDRSTFPRDKVCGDGIGPHAGDVLRGLGAEGILHAHERFAAYRMRGPSGHEVTSTSARTGWVVPRHTFDARLLEVATGCGAEFVAHRVRDVAVESDGVVVDDAYKAGVVIAADGANSVVRRALGLDRNPPAHRAVALRGYAQRPVGLDEIAFTWEGASGLAYSWAFPTADDRVNVGSVRLASNSSGGRRTLEQALRARLPDLPPEDGTLRGHTLPLSSHRPDPAPHPRVLLTGDAASLINPLSGEGIYYALASGSLAGEAAVVADDPAAHYRSGLRALFDVHWRHARLLAASLRIPGAITAGLLAARSEPAVLEALIDLGLGRGTLTRRGVARTARGVVRHVASRRPSPAG